MRGFPLIARYILIIILVISFILFAFINIASSTVLSKEYVLGKLDETNYYNGIYQELESNFEKYSQQSGLEEGALTQIISEEKVKDDVITIISNIYDGTDQEIDVTEIRTNLNNNIQQSISNLGVGNVNQEAVETFINTICDEYANTMSHTQYEQDINNVVMKVLKYTQMAKKALLIIMLVDIIFIFAICNKRLYKGISSIGVAAISSGVFNVVANVFVNSKIKINTITILNNTISNSLREILNNIVDKVSNYGYIFIGIGLVLVLLGNIIDSIKYEEER